MPHPLKTFRNGFGKDRSFKQKIGSPKTSKRLTRFLFRPPSDAQPLGPTCPLSARRKTEETQNPTTQSQKPARPERPAPYPLTQPVDRERPGRVRNRGRNRGDYLASMTRSINPYFRASSAVIKLSRSVSWAMRSTGCPVWAANMRFRRSRVFSMFRA